MSVCISPDLSLDIVDEVLWLAEELAELGWPRLLSLLSLRPVVIGGGRARGVLALRAGSGWVDSF